MSSSNPSSNGSARSRRALLVGTRKGAWILRPTGKEGFALEGPQHFGSKVCDFQQDPRAPRTHLLSVGGGHLGPSLFRSEDGCESWTESSKPPAFEPAPEDAKPMADGTSRGNSVSANFWIEPGHASRAGEWFLGTCPQGLFKSTDNGDTWSGVDGFNLNPKYYDWVCGGDEVPDGPFLHSVRIDPRDAQHMYLSMSLGGTFESRDAGATWAPLNRGVEVNFGPEKFPEFGQDPHCMIQHPADPDLLYQQNHCGIYRVDRKAGDEWTRIGNNMPEGIGDIGFGIVGHPRERNTVWVFPMDGTELWPRTSPNGKPAVYRSDDGGESWKRLDRGLPQEQGWYTVKRQALCGAGTDERPEICFGTTGGELWVGFDGGERFERVATSLPEILSVRAADPTGLA